MASGHPRAARSLLPLLCLLAVFCLVGQDATFTAPTGRRSMFLYPTLGVFGALPSLPAKAVIQQGPEERLALYKGKAVSVREAAQWYRFYVGDVVTRGSGKDTGDGLKASDTACGAGTCDAAQALSELDKLVSPGHGSGKISQVERDLTTPIFLMVGYDVWDPDASFSEDARKAAGKFHSTVKQMSAKLSPPYDAQVASHLYTKSLKDLNDFFRIANEAADAQPHHAHYLPPLPVSQRELDTSEYWKAEQEAYDEANNPSRLFYESNALR